MKHHMATTVPSHASWSPAFSKPRFGISFVAAVRHALLSDGKVDVAMNGQAASARNHRYVAGHGDLV
jgi:hypothetical protein